MKSVIELATEVDIEFAHDRIHEMVASYEDDRAFRLRWLERFAEVVRAEREWVDLTDDELYEIISKDAGDTWIDAIRTVIAAFKGKNK